MAWSPDGRWVVLRWSPDGHWIAYGSYPGLYRSTRGKLYVLGIDQNTGQITQAAAPVDIEGQMESAIDPSWMPRVTIWRYDVQFWMLRADQRQP